MLAPLRHGNVAAMHESTMHERSRAIRTATRRALVLEMRRRAMETREAAKRRVCNGIDIDQLEGMAEAIRAEPEAGMVTIRTRHRWDEGYAVDGSAEELENAGEVTGRTFSFRTDWPPDAGGGDSGPTPGELVLAALGACLASTYATKAASADVEIDQLEVTLEAPVDFRGLLELAPVRPGLAGVKATVTVRSEADDAALEALAEAVGRTSPVYDTLANPVPIELSVDRVGEGRER
jgi:uncharacterized OsmC-like protein